MSAGRSRRKAAPKKEAPTGGAYRGFYVLTLKDRPDGWGLSNAPNSHSPLPVPQPKATFRTMGAALALC
jgi:hypothetical protein